MRSPINMLHTHQVLHDVAEERKAQHFQWGQQNLPDGTGQPCDEADRDHLQLQADRATLSGTLSWRLLLEEEVAEALAETDQERLREELVQVAAVAVQWIEALDRRGGS